VRHGRKTGRKLGQGGAHRRAAMAAMLRPNPAGSALLRSVSSDGRSRKEGWCVLHNLFRGKSSRGEKGGNIGIQPNPAAPQGRRERAGDGRRGHAAWPMWAHLNRGEAGVDRWAPATVQGGRVKRV
jgi:hypothetical protein